jgi:heme A synthase
MLKAQTFIKVVAVIFFGLCVHIVWTDRLFAVGFLIPIAIVIAAWKSASMWERKQPSRLLARYRSLTQVICLFCLVALVQCVGLIYFPKYVERGTGVIVLGLLFAAYERRKLTRWVKYFSTARSAEPI